MTDYRATPDQWVYQERWAVEDSDAACLLELRARIEALEANTYKWRCDHLRLANTCASLAPDRSKFFADLMPDGDEDDTNKYPSSSQQVPVTSLVERVVMAIGRDCEPARWNEARAAILEVVAYLEHLAWDTKAMVLVKALRWEAGK